MGGGPSRHVPDSCWAIDKGKSQFWVDVSFLSCSQQDEIAPSLWDLLPLSDSSLDAAMALACLHSFPWPEFPSAHLPQIRQDHAPCLNLSSVLLGWLGLPLGARRSVVALGGLAGGLGEQAGLQRVVLEC